MARVARIRQDFPILQRQIRGKPLVYLDNAASSQKPESVIRAMDDYYRQTNANVHRGVHTLSEEATTLYENARLRIARFINAPSDKQVIFTRNTTESINLVAFSWGRANLGPGDEVLITEMEHHSNIVPWQILRDQLGFTLRYIPLADDGTLDLTDLEALINARTKLVAFVHMSNVLGVINPVKTLVDAAHAVGAKVLIDGAQSVPHMPVDVQALDADFFAFSSHKMCGPTGMGVLYGKRAILEAMPPFMGGGDMIREVKMSGSQWNTLPYKFEAGTPSIAEGIGLGAAVDYLAEVGMEWVWAHEREITRYAYERMAQVEGLRILGPGPEQRGGLVAFTLNDIHPHDLSAVLDGSGIAIRAGHHCAQPIHDRLGIVASARASFYLYNTFEEVDQLIVGLEQASEIFAF
ncbi:MAG: cysteine desulfurase [Caldilineaceae bacterium]|nr:cysteine desulfurase [Caldilineaceae bacterium]MBP8109648.1 cysteine desulfurase [Caldilineaceae bacterium]MBP8124360.1 cysteine desulfurase [Caldilineaceae bacterium]MBP9074351.1 cysteine desulfurase [Caldilineaceae bacterium]